MSARRNHPRGRARLPVVAAPDPGRGTDRREGFGDRRIYAAVDEAGRLLEVVADGNMKSAESLHFQFDPIAVLKGVQATVVRAGCNDVTRFEWMD